MLILGKWAFFIREPGHNVWLLVRQGNNEAWLSTTLCADGQGTSSQKMTTNQKMMCTHGHTKDAIWRQLINSFHKYLRIILRQALF